MKTTDELRAELEKVNKDISYWRARCKSKQDVPPDVEVVIDKKYKMKNGNHYIENIYGGKYARKKWLECENKRNELEIELKERND